MQMQVTRGLFDAGHVPSGEGETNRLLLWYGQTAAISYSTFLKEDYHV